MNKINKYLVYDLIGTAIYGLVLYFGFTWLAGHSLIFAYLWNFVLILIAIIFDRYGIKATQSDEYIKKMKEKYGNKKTIAILTGGFLTFKTLLYLFYIFILVASQIINFDPALMGENLVNFILANNYSILFLLALDTLNGQFTKDKERMNKLADKLKQSTMDGD